MVAKEGALHRREYKLALQRQPKKSLNKSLNQSLMPLLAIYAV